MKLIAILATLFSIGFAVETIPALGINCRGSSQCLSCKQPLGDDGMLDFLKGHLSDDSTFKSGQQIACKSCHLTQNEGLCVFAQKLGDKTVTGKQVKEAVQRLRDHGCNYCGSAPIYPGNNVNDGEITVNYVTDGCIKHGDKIC